MCEFVSDLTQTISMDSLYDLYEEMVSLGYSDRMMQWIFSGFKLDGSDVVYTLNPFYLFEIEFDLVLDKLELPSSLFSIDNLVRMELVSYLGDPRLPVFSLPENFNLPQLVELKISLHFITDVPKSIFYLPSLKILDLSNNSLNDFQILSSLNTRIEELYIHSNELKSLPTIHLPRLRILDISLNFLSILPDISHLSKLISLRANKNQIVRIAKSIFNLPLEELILANNLVNEIPDLDVNVSQLKVLNLSHNFIPKFPTGLGKLVNLEQLFLSYNELESLPVSIQNMKKLELIDIQSNYIRKLPNFNNLKNLRELNIMENNLIELPTLPDLSKLYFSKDEMDDKEFNSYREFYGTICCM